MPSATVKEFWFRSSVDIVERRKKLGLTQSAFWVRVGITQSGGSRYESGRDIPPPVALLLQVAYGTERQALALVAQMRQPPSPASPRR